MKKHYSFIPLKDKDLSSFRKSVLISLIPRPAFAVLTLAILGFIAYSKLELLQSEHLPLLVFSIGAATVLYILLLELQKVYTILRLRKSSLLPYIHVRGLDSSFYIEEVTNGFIIQVAAVQQEDISNCMNTLSEMNTRYSECTRLAEYLTACLISGDHHLVNKAVIYAEIVHDQLEKGNKDILATYDKLVNFREDLF